MKLLYCDIFIDLQSDNFKQNKMRANTSNVKCNYFTK